MTTKTTNTRVEFVISTVNPVEEIYIVGSHAKLGEWDVTKAIKLEYNESKNAFCAIKMLPAGSEVEYKILAAKSWNNVEKGIFGEELPNRVFTAVKGTKVEIVVSNFA